MSVNNDYFPAKSGLLKSYVFRGFRSARLLLTVHLEVRVERVDAISREVPQVHSQLVATLVSQQEHVVISEPMFASHVPKAGPVVRPAAIEELLTILASLEEEPTASRGLHVAPHGNRAGGIQGLDVVYSAAVMARVIHARTV